MIRPFQPENPVRRPRRAFTLLESLMASAILLGIVTAVTSAVVAGQQHAFEAQQRIGATLAAESLMSRLVLEEYADLAGWNGYIEAVGAMVDETGAALPPTFGALGRDVAVIDTFRNFTPPNVSVRGMTIRVRSFDESGRALVELERFVPEPQS